MIFPQLFREGKLSRLILSLLALVGLLSFGSGTTHTGLAASAACAQPVCIYLPSVSRNLDPRARSESLGLYRDMYLASQAPSSMGWNGDVDACNPGNISVAYRAAVLLRVNYFRLMAGVPQIKGFRAEYNQQAQAAALLYSRNNKIDHNPDAIWTWCKTLAASTKDGIQFSIANFNVNGPDAASSYMRDEGNDLVYLRRYMLFPQTVEMGDGDIPATGSYKAINVLYVIDMNHMFDPRPATRDEFVAWPPAAYVPYQVVPALWSFSYAGADFSHASVSVLENGIPKGITLRTPQDCITPPVTCYGESTLVWKVGDWGPWPNPGADKTYTVTVSNVLIAGHAKTFTYNVIVFDPGL